jgi:hypothetical protein
MDAELGLPTEIVSVTAGVQEECHKTFDNHTESTYFRKLVEAAISGNEAKYSYGYLSFDILHRLILLNHQHKLAQHVRDVMVRGISDEEQLRGIDEDLHAYRPWENLCDFYGLAR